MRIAKPNKNDFEAAFELIKLLNSANNGYFPENDDSDDTDPLYSDDQSHLKRFFELAMKIVEQNPSALERIIWGMAALSDGGAFDQNADFLALHPRFIEQQTEGDV